MSTPNLTPQLSGPPPDPVAQLLMEFETVRHRAQRVVMGLPPVDPPPPVPSPPPVHELGRDQIQEIGDALAKLPPDKRAKAMVEAHSTISKLLLQQGKMVVNGKLEVIKTPEQADAAAKTVINDEVDRREKVADDADKAADKAAKDKVKQDAQAPTARGSRQTSRQKAEALSAPKFEVVEAPQKRAREPKPEPVKSLPAVAAAAPSAPAHIAEDGPLEFEVVEGKTQKVESRNAPEHDAQRDPVNVRHETETVREFQPGPGSGVPSIAARSEDRGAAGEVQPANGNGLGKVPQPVEAAAAKPVGTSEAVGEKPYEKGDAVTFGKNFQLAKGEGKSEIIRAGTKASIEYVNPDMKFARVRAGDGRVHSVPFKYLEAGNGQADEAVKAAEVQPAKQSGAGEGSNVRSGVVPAAAEAGAGAGLAPREGIAGGDRSGERAALTETERAKTETKPAKPQTTKHKFGNTQAPIAKSSDAHKALETARARISDSDLMAKGKDVEGNHVTVRYGIKGDDVEGIRKFLSEQAPFEATLSKTEKFPPSEHSDGAAPIIAPIEAPELHRMNAELEKQGEFTEPSFKEYKPHATVAYVKPDKADRYVGMKATHGKTFIVDRVQISDKNGDVETVKLEGKPPEKDSKAGVQDLVKHFDNYRLRS